MAGAELIGKEEIKEVMDVLETGILMRYGFDKERKGIYKVREFEQGVLPNIAVPTTRWASPPVRRPSRSR